MKNGVLLQMCTIISLFALSVLQQLAGQETVFENPPPTAFFVSDVDAGQIFTARAAITEDKTIVSVSWNGGYDGPVPATDDIVIEVFEDNGGVPAVPPIASFQVGNNVNRINGENFSSYTAEVNFLMKAGLVYWISIYDQDGGTNSDFGWGISPGTGINNFPSFNGGNTWGSGGDELVSFSLQGIDPVPETVFENSGVSNSTFSDVDAGQIFAARAVSTEDKNIELVRWSGSYNGTIPATDDFVIEVFGDNGGAPAVPPIASFQVGNNVNRTTDGPISSYSAEVDFLMEAGEVYWVSIYDRDGGSNSNFFWRFEPSSGVNNFVSLNGGNSWPSGAGGLFAFSLLGFDPAPETVFENSGVSNGIFSDVDAGTIFAARAVSAEDKNIELVRWTGSYNGAIPDTDDFVIEVFADDGGVPAVPPIASFPIGNGGNRILDGSFFAYTAEVDFLMKAGEVYWISIYDQDGGNNSDWRWRFEPSSGINNFVSFNGGNSWGSGAGGLFAFSLLGFDPAPPSNDNWSADAIGIFDDDFPVTVEGTNISATTQTGEQQLSATGATVWWFVDFPADGTATIDTFGSDYDTQLHIYEGFGPGVGVEDLIPVVNNDDAPGVLQSRVEFPVEAGECFEIRVGGFSNSVTPVRQGCIVLNIVFEESILLGDINCDGLVNLLDVAPFVDLVSNGGFSEKADINQDGAVNLLDVQPFVLLLSGG